MPEEALQKLEMAWEQVAIQTSWKLEPCMAPANFLVPPVEMVLPPLTLIFHLPWKMYALTNLM